MLRRRSGGCRGTTSPIAAHHPKTSCGRMPPQPACCRQQLHQAVPVRCVRRRYSHRVQPRCTTGCIPTPAFHWLGSRTGRGDLHPAFYLQHLTKQPLPRRPTHLDEPECRLQITRSNANARELSPAPHGKLQNKSVLHPRPATYQPSFCLHDWR